jgi:hypothetical protein
VRSAVPKRVSFDTTEFRVMLTAVREATSVEGRQEEGRRAPLAVRRLTSSMRQRDGAGRKRVEEESERGPLTLLNYPVVVEGGSRGVGMDGGESAGAFDELDEFVIIASDPLPLKRTGQCQAEREGLAGGVHVEDGCQSSTEQYQHNRQDSRLLRKKSVRWEDGL